MRPTVLERLERLPRRNLTVMALRGISTLVPGGWENITSGDELIRRVMGSSDPELIAQVRARANELSNARHEGYGRALSLYDAVNRSQKATGGLRVLANVAGGLPIVKRLAMIAPSSPMLITPARSLTHSPSAANASGVAVRTLASRKLAALSSPPTV
jgi:hypothetical protein